MSENLDLVRSIFVDWERGDFRSTAWAHPEIEWMMADGPVPGNWAGLAGMTEGWRKFRSVWAEYRFEPQDYREVNDAVVLVLGRFTGRGKASEPTLREMQSEAARLFHIRDGKVTRLVIYLEGERALADLGLGE